MENLIRDSALLCITFQKSKDDPITVRDLIDTITFLKEHNVSERLQNRLISLYEGDYDFTKDNILPIIKVLDWLDAGKLKELLLIAIIHLFLVYVNITSNSTSFYL